MTEGVTHYWGDNKPRGAKYMMTTYTPEALERLELLQETPLFEENMKTLRDESYELAMESGCENKAMEVTFEDMGMSMTFKEWRLHQYITGMCREKIIQSYHDRSQDTFAYYFTDYKNDGHPDGLERAIIERATYVANKKKLQAAARQSGACCSRAAQMKRQNIMLKEENKRLKAQVQRLIKERNFLGDYQGGATSDSDSESD